MVAGGRALQRALKSPNAWLDERAQGSPDDLEDGAGFASTPLVAALELTDGRFPVEPGRTHVGEEALFAKPEGTINPLGRGETASLAAIFFSQLVRNGSHRAQYSEAGGVSRAACGCQTLLGARFEGIDEIDAAVLEVTGVTRGDAQVIRAGDRGDLRVERADGPADFLA